MGRLNHALYRNSDHARLSNRPRFAGEMEPLEGTYGVQNTFTKFVEYCREAIFATRSPYFITYAKREKEAKEAAETLEAALGYPPEMICQMGASTVYGNGRAALLLYFRAAKQNKGSSLLKFY